VIDAVQAETAWVHTHGLRELGLPELEIRDVPRFMSAFAGELLNEIADYLLDPERPVRVGDLIELEPMGLIQLVPAEPQEYIIEGHYDHERWAIVDAPLEMCRCPVCQAKAKAPGLN
jgi:hypothetical protein